MSKIKETAFPFIITIIFFSFGVVGNIAAAFPADLAVLGLGEVGTADSGIDAGHGQRLGEIHRLDPGVGVL